MYQPLIYVCNYQFLYIWLHVDVEGIVQMIYIYILYIIKLLVEAEAAGIVQMIYIIYHKISRGSWGEKQIHY